LKEQYQDTRPEIKNDKNKIIGWPFPKITRLVRTDFKTVVGISIAN
jgi:hypothetical protein